MCSRRCTGCTPRCRTSSRPVPRSCRCHWRLAHSHGVLGTRIRCTPGCEREPVGAQFAEEDLVGLLGPDEVALAGHGVLELVGIDHATRALVVVVLDAQWIELAAVVQQRASSSGRAQIGRGRDADRPVPLRCRVERGRGRGGQLCGEVQDPMTVEPVQIRRPVTAVLLAGAGSPTTVPARAGTPSRAWSSGRRRWSPRSGTHCARSPRCRPCTSSTGGAARGSPSGPGS